MRSRSSLVDRRRSPRGEDGFILLESMVALSLITVLMAALASFTLNVVSGTNELRARQGATQLATSTMDLIGALPATDLVSRRDPASVDSQFTEGNKSDVVRPWLATMTPLKDSTPGLTGTGATAAVPTIPTTQVVNNITYSVSTYLGTCSLRSTDPTTGSDCVVSGSGTTELRAVVAVTWSGRGCRAATSCSYVTATLVNADPDPVFNTNRAVPPPKPVVVPPGDQTSTRGGTDALQLTVAAGTGLGTLTWQVTSGTLPAGLTLSASGLISGTPTVLVTKTPLTVTVTDAFGRTATASFTWTVLAPPTITTPPAQSTVVGRPVTLTVASTCPNSPCTYVLSGPPAGLGIDSATGVITGTPTTLGTSPAVTVTATDADGVAVSTSPFSWVVRAAATIGPLGNVLTTVGVATNTELRYTCPAAPCTITLGNSVPGLGLSATSGVTGTNNTTSLTVTAASGVVYVAGTVAGSAVSSAASGSSAVYTVTATVTDPAGSTASSGTWTATRTTLVNYALGRTTSQSTTAFFGDSARAVDGTTNGDYNANSTTHTDTQSQPWWQVDLGAATTVRTVMLYNRTDCCADRLANGQVFFSATDMTGKTYDQLIADPAVTEVAFGTLSNAAQAISANDTRARYVRVQISGTNYLSLAEVQVLGANLAATRTATQSGTDLLFGAAASRAVDGNTDGVFANGSVSQTSSAVQSWWQVDLATSSTISAVTVWNRTDCCANRLNGAYLLVSATDMTGRTAAQLNADSSVTKILIGATPGTRTTIAVGGVAGRYVRIQLPGTTGGEIVSLAEVQVNGTLP